MSPSSAPSAKSSPPPLTCPVSRTLPRGWRRQVTCRLLCGEREGELHVNLPQGSPCTMTEWCAEGSGAAHLTWNRPGLPQRNDRSRRSRIGTAWAVSEVTGGGGSCVFLSAFSRRNGVDSGNFRRIFQDGIALCIVCCDVLSRFLNLCLRKISGLYLRSNCLLR